MHPLTPTTNATTTTPPPRRHHRRAHDRRHSHRPHHRPLPHPLIGLSLARCEPLDACIDDDEKRSLDVYREHLYKGLKQMAKGKGTGDAINYFSFFTRKAGSSSAR